MNYKIIIYVHNDRGDALLEKEIRLNNLDNILDLDLASIYAEAQQQEINNGLEIPDLDETDTLTNFN